MKKLIQSATKNKFGKKPDNYEEIAGGLMSKTYRVNINDKNYIFQINETTEPHELENCVNCFSFLKDSKIPVPKTVSGLKKYESNYYTIVEAVEGKTLEEDISKNESIKSGKLLAKLHNYRSFEKSGWWKWKNDQPEVTGFPGNSLKARIEQLMTERKKFFEKRQLEELEKMTGNFLEKHLEKIPDDFKPVIVHHDFSPGNILSKEGEITAVLDFDYAHSSHAQRDLAKASNKFWLRGGKRKHLYEGYKESRELGEFFHQNKLIYQLESLLDEIAAMLDHDHISKKDALKYVEELKRIESEIT